MEKSKFNAQEQVRIAKENFGKIFDELFSGEADLWKMDKKLGAIAKDFMHTNNAAVTNVVLNVCLEADTIRSILEQLRMYTYMEQAEREGKRPTDLLSEEPIAKGFVQINKDALFQVIMPAIKLGFEAQGVIIPKDLEKPICKVVYDTFIQIKTEKLI